jgi:hypothetical protein
MLYRLTNLRYRRPAMRRATNLARAALRQPAKALWAAAGIAWALPAVAVTKRRLKRNGTRTKAPRAPRLGDGSLRGVMAVIGRLEPTCLERSLVLQSYLRAQGDEREVVIGVRTDEDGFAAHAWLAGEEEGYGAGYEEIHRLH